MTDLEQNTAIANEAREVIDAEIAVGMVRDGFHVFIDNTNEPLTYDMLFGKKELFDLVEGSHVFTAPMMEVAQKNALESLCGKFDSLNNDVRDDGGMSLEDYADELYDEHDDESQYRWRGSLSEWGNIRKSILSDKTEYLQLFLNDVSLSYPSIVAELREELNDYTSAYLNRNKVENIPQTQDNSHNLTNADLSAERGESRGNTMEQNNAITIKGNECRPTDNWEEHGVFYIVGQSIDDPSFYYARATNGDVTREYEYDHKPEREKVVSDHYDKLAEEDIDRREAIYGADGYSMFPQGESRGNTMAEHNTTFEVSSISKIENDSKVKALASVVINGEFAVRGIRVLEGEKGLFVAMPNKKYGDEYSDIAFPITTEARTALNNAVMNGYNQLMQSEGKTLKNEIPAAEQVNSSVKVSLKSIGNYEHIKAAGQITIDNCFVVKDVKVIETEGKPPFVSMPSYQTNTGEYKEFAIPITKEMHEKLNKSVLEKYQTLGKDKPKHDKQNEPAKTAEKEKQKQKQTRTTKHKR